MKRFSFILILSIIFTAYLFSQIEENEIIKVDTVTRVDTVVVEQQEKKDFKKYDFYNDYLANLPKINDTLAIDDSKKIGIISAKAECTLFFIGGSVTWNMPLRYYRGLLKTHFSCYKESKYIKILWKNHKIFFNI